MLFAAYVGNRAYARHVLLGMSAADENDDSFWMGARRFADRHIRLFTIALCLLAVPIALVFLLPTILVATATPITAPVRLKATLSLTYLDRQGKVIGRQGRIARALRTVVRASAVREQRRVRLEIVD